MAGEVFRQRFPYEQVAQQQRRFVPSAATSGAQAVAPVSIASAEAHGTARIDQFIGLTGVISAEAHGGTTVAPGAVSVVCAGIGTAEAFGTHAVSQGAVNIAPTGLVSAGAFGTCQLNLNINGLIKFAGHCVGDSMIDSPGLSGQNLHNQLMALRTHETWTRHVTTGNPAGHFPALISNFATRVQAFFVSGALNVVWVFSVSHGDLQDDGSATASSVFDLAIDFVDLAHSNNWLVGIVTVPPTTEYNDSGSSPYRRPKRKDYNNLLRYGDATRARWAGADFFVDLEPVSGMGQDELPSSGNPGGVYWQSDGIHPTAAAITVVRDLADRSMRSVQSREAVTQPTVAPVQTVAPSGLATAGAFGSHVVTPGQVSLVCTGLASGEGHGTTVVTAGTVLAPSGLASAEATGSHTVAPGTATVACTGIASAEAHGACTVAPGGVTLLPSGLASAEAHGTQTVTRGSVSIVCTGIASAEGHGSAALALNVAPTALSSSEAHGSVALGLFVSCSGVSTSEAHGSATVAPGAVNLLPTGLASAAAFGSHVFDLAGQLTIAAQGLASAEVHGTPTLVPGAVSVVPSGIASAQQAGTPTLTLNLLVSAIGSGEAAGNPSLALQLLGQGLPSAEAFGTALLDLKVLPVGVVSAEAIGTGLVQLVLGPTGVASAEAVGAPTVINALVILPGGIASLEGFGAHLVLPAGVMLQPIGVASGELFGVPLVDALVFVVAGPRETVRFAAPNDTVKFR